MPNQDNKETVRRIIHAVEHPDNPERKAAIAIQEAKEQKRQQSERVFILISRLIFVAQFVIFLVAIWKNNSTLPSRWLSLILGSIAGMIVFFLIERKKTPTQRPLSPSVILITVALVFTVHLLENKIEQWIPASIRASIAIFIFSFFSVLAVYALILYYRKMIREWKKSG